MLNDIIKRGPSNVKDNSLKGFSVKAYAKNAHRLLTEFTITRSMLSLKETEDGKIHLPTRLFLSCLIASSIKTRGRTPTLLTSTKQLADHFNMTQQQVRNMLHKLSTTHIKGTPLISYSTCNLTKEAELYSADNIIPTAPVIKHFITKEGKKGVPLKIRTHDDTKIKTEFITDLRALLDIDYRECIVKIKIPSYEYLKYNKEVKGDFFFDVHITLYKDELTISERIMLFLIQWSIQNNIEKKMPAKSITSLQTYAEWFGTDKRHIHEILRGLQYKDYIEYDLYKQRLDIELTIKSTREIQRLKTVQKKAQEEAQTIT